MSCDHLLKELRLLESNPLFDIYLDLFLLCLLGLGYPDLKDTIPGISALTTTSPLSSKISRVL